jgi:hypothetical protein
VKATSILVRRVKQGVAEWFRLQLKEKAWKGFARGCSEPTGSASRVPKIQK